MQVERGARIRFMVFKDSHCGGWLDTNKKKVYVGVSYIFYDKRLKSTAHSNRNRYQSFIHYYGIGFKGPLEIERGSRGSSPS